MAESLRQLRDRRGDPAGARMEHPVAQSVRLEAKLTGSPPRPPDRASERKRQAALDPTAILSDDALMSRLTDGDHHAYCILVHRHVDRLYRLAQRITGDRAEAEDLVQEAFLRLWVRASRWQPERGCFTTWLSRIIVNLSIDHVRKHRGEALERVAELADTAPRADVESCIQRQQIGQRVAAEVRRLPFRQRTALALCYYEGFSNLEAAEILGVGVGALEALLVRARRSLRGRLAALIER